MYDGSKISLTVGENTISWPRAVFEEGARTVGVSSGTYMEAEHYALSVRAVLTALKERGIDTIAL